MNEDNMPDFVPSDMFPVGKKEELPEIKALTLGLTLGGCVLIAIAMILKSTDKVYPQWRLNKKQK